MKFLIILSFFLCLSPSVYAEVTWFLSEKESTHKLALVPSYRRSETLGSVVSGRIFVYPTQESGLYTSFSADWGFGKKNYGFKQSTIYWTPSQNEWGFSGEWNRTFDSYYKETSTTRLEVPIRQRWLKAYYLDSGILKKIHPQIQTGISVEIQSRKEDAVQPCIFIQENTQKLKTPCQAYNPVELGGTVGWILRIDTRDNSFDPSVGYLLQTDFQIGKEIEAKNLIFFQAEGQMQFIFSLFQKERWFVKIASAWTFYNGNYSHELPYSFQYKLGGINQLRGYLKDRWHSDKYYLMQFEFRYPISKWIQPLLFADIGHVDVNKTPLFTYGGGIRIGLPPSYKQKIRVEYGRGKDQSNFIISFARPY